MSQPDPGETLLSERRIVVARSTQPHRRREATATMAKQGAKNETARVGLKDIGNLL